MTLFSFFTAEQNLPFAVSAALFLAVGAAEAVMLSVGASAEIGDSESDGIALLNWLNPDRLPLLMLLVLALASFAIIGFGLQIVVLATDGTLLRASLASVCALCMALPATRWLSRGVNRVMPKDETYAVTQYDLLNRAAELVIGTARAGSPAQAKVKDTHGTTHYVMIEPAEASEIIKAGDRVMLTSWNGTVYTCKFIS
jgi:Protein of unknown function (DUF1449)